MKILHSLQNYIEKYCLATTKISLIGTFWNFLIIGLFLLPVWSNLSTPFFISSITLGLIALFVKDLLDFRKIRKKWYFLSYPLVMVFMVFSLIYTKDFEYGVKIIERCLPLFFLPIIFTFIESNKEITGKIFRSLTLGVLLSFLINIIEATHNSLSIVDGKLIFDTSIEGGWSFYESFKHGGSHFIGGEFSKNVHPSYISMYALCCIVFLVRSNSKRSLRLLVISFLLIYLFLLASRAALIILFILIIIYLIRENRGSAISLVLGILVGAALLLNPRLQNLYKGIINFSEKDNFNYTTSEQSRILIYKSAIDLISESFLFGYGVGDGDKELLDYYKKHEYLYVAKFEYNAHNQFLQTSLQIGVLGVILLCLPFLFFYNKKLDNDSGAYYCIILFSSLLFESMLVRYNGIIFFSTMVPLILNENLRQVINISSQE